VLPAEQTRVPSKSATSLSVAVGSDEDNLSWSDRRAEAVAVILTEEFQVPPENLLTRGYGEQFLRVETDQPEQANRRVVVRPVGRLLAKNDNRRGG
jgi:hypothetical protein